MRANQTLGEPEGLWSPSGYEVSIAWIRGSSARDQKRDAPPASPYGMMRASWCAGGVLAPLGCFAYSSVRTGAISTGSAGQFNSKWAGYYGHILSHRDVVVTTVNACSNPETTPKEALAN